MTFCLRMAPAAAAAILLSAPAAFGQWINYPRPGIPRTADGKPDLNAPVPKTAGGKPDLSGIWVTNSAGYGLDLTTGLKPGDILPWAEALSKQRAENLSTGHPGYRCMPDIGPLISFGMVKILQTPGTIAFLAEGEPFRQVLTDGRPLPKDPNPTWQGYSVGHWEGDTLVIESAGYNDKTWLDFKGHPHTEDLHITERYHRKDFGHMDVTMTFDDPKAYRHPWTIALTGELKPDTELLEYVCNENERDARHIVVTEEDRKKFRTTVKVAPEILARYAGVYQAVDQQGEPLDKDGKPVTGDANPEKLIITVDGDQLILQVGAGAGKIPLMAESENHFSVAGQPLEFVTNAQGKVTQLILHLVEGDRKAIRERDLP